MEVWKCIILTFLCFWLEGSAFNVDTKHPVILSGKKGSYFGYSVAFHKNKEGSLALVTAPKANFSLWPSVHEPGALYKCQTSSDQCEVVILERTGNYPSQGPSGDYAYLDNKNGSWLGVSLDVQAQGPGHVVTCSHLWKNQIYKGHYLVNGACYVLNKELELGSVKKLIPLVDRKKQSIIPPGIYYYALGQAGTSVAFSENGKDLLLGAPGLNDWLGTVIDYKVSDHPRQISRPVVPNPPISQDLTPESYIGYSVTTGHFYELAGMSYAAGAPRDGGNNGRVYIFEHLGPTKSRIVVQNKLEGEQLAEYFGAAILTVDLSNNGFTDLLVGAPMHSLKTGGDEGRVYVFLTDGVGLTLQKDMIVGSSKAFSRFGTALAKAGDVNQDGYQDVVIGAPYEGNGAVYLYHGSKTGLKPLYSQRIAADNVDPNLKGFGISVARGADSNGNHYPDLLVGSYSSDNAVILRTSPVAFISPRIEFEVSQIDLNVTRCDFKGKKATCFKLQACLKLSGKHIPSILDVLVELSADVSEARAAGKSGGHQPRAMFIQTDGPDSAFLREGINLQADQERCLEVEVRILPEDILDIITPMTFQMNFSLLANEHPEIDGFCKDCPVLDPSIITSIKKQIQFRTGCGEDNTCSADLMLYSHVMGLGEEEPLILGANNSITVEVRVANIGEPAYAAMVAIKLPPGVQIVNQAKCVMVEGEEIVNKTLDCRLGNPLKKGQPSTFQIKLDISKLDYNLEEITIKLVATTASQEQNPRDNAMLLRVPLRALADITIRGHAEQEQVVYESKTEIIPMDHNYVILKYYPSPIQSVGVAMYIPIFDRRTRIQIVKIENIQVGDTHSSTVPGSCNASSLATTPDALEEQENALNKGSKDAPNTINLIGYSSAVGNRGAAPQNLQEDGSISSQSQVKEQKASYVMNCGNSLCQTIICSVGPFLDNSKFASIRIKAHVNITAMNFALGNQPSVSIVTGGRVWIRDYDYFPQPDDDRPDEDEVSTVFNSPEQPAQPIDKWIIAVAIGAGFLLLGLILLALLKLGFFRREKKEEMEKMLQKGALLPATDDSDNPKGDVASDNEDVASDKEPDEFDYINFADANT